MCLRVISSILLLGVRNRDVGVYHQPDEFLVSRAGAPHLSFGRGEHQCLGISLVKLEAKVFLRAFLSHFPRFRIEEDSVDWSVGLAARGMKQLIVYPG